MPEHAQRGSSEEKLLELEHRYRSIFENATEGIFQTTVEGSYLSVNRALADIYGYASPEDLMRTVSDIRSQLYAEVTRRAEFKSAMTSKGVVKDFVSEIFRKDGSRIWIRENAHVVRGVNGEILYYEGWVEDVTDKLAAEAELVRAKVAAEQGSRAKSEFLATMSHELRTPLNGILGMTEILLGSKLDHDQMDCVQTLQGSASTLLALVNDILDFSKIEAGKIDLECAPIELEDIVDDCLRVLAPLAAEKGLFLHVDWGEGVPETLLGDSLRLRQCLSNLVNNAIKFTARGGIHVRICCGGDEANCARIRFEVEDTGVGIAPEVAAKLFQPFTQGDASTTRQFGGTGLGLAIVQRLVGLMGGETGLRSQLGSGSVFYFHVLLGRGATRKLASASAPSVHIVATDPRAGRYWSTCFRRGGAHVLSVISPTHFQANAISAALVVAEADVELPDLTVPVLRVAPLGAVARGQLSSPLRMAEVRRALSDPPKPARVNSSSADVIIANANPVEQKVLSVQLARLGLNSRVMADPRTLPNSAALPDNSLILLDCDMRGVDVFDLIARRRVQEQSGLGSRLRIVGLTEPNSNQAEKCRAAGGDGCLPKPVHPQKLIALLRAERLV